MQDSATLIPEAFGAAIAPVRHLPISPMRVVNGEGALAGLGSLVRDHGPSALVIAGSQGFATCRDAVAESLDRAELTWQVASLAHDCCEEDLAQLAGSFPEAAVIVGIGGGKVMDAAKLLAHRRGVPVVTVPTAAATCAAWTALSNVYTPLGQWRFGVPLPTGPSAVLVDYGLIARAPARLLASGIADTLAKWIESSASVDPAQADAMTLAALQMARFLYDRLLEIGPAAMAQAREGRLGPELMQAIDLNVQLAGTVGGLGGARCRSVAAHAVCNGLTQIETRRASWHGEKVAFGIIVQLILQGRPFPEILELLGFYRAIGLPMTFAELGIPSDDESLLAAATFACDARSSIHLLPTPVTPEVVVAALAEADRLARETCAPTA